MLFRSFKRITVEEIESRLRYITAEMKMEAEDEALAMIAIQADGGMRDALSILDQCAALAEGTITAERVRQILGLVGHDWIYKMTKALAARNVQEALQILAELLRDGKDLKQVLSELSLHLRSLMIFQAAGTVEAMDLYAEPQDVLQQQILQRVAAEAELGEHRERDGVGGAFAHLRHRTRGRAELLGPQRLDRVDHRNLRLLRLQGNENLFQIDFSKQLEVPRIERQPARAHGDLLPGFFTAHIQHVLQGGKLGQRLQQQGALANPRITAEQHDAAGDQPAADLRRIYTAATAEEAELMLGEFEERWDAEYLPIGQSWRRNWSRLIPFFDYPPEIRKVIYTTNAIESVNMSLRKLTKNRGSFPSDEALTKLFYLALRNISQKWTMPIRDWKAALTRFTIQFGDRISVN